MLHRALLLARSDATFPLTCAPDVWGQRGAPCCTLGGGLALDPFADEPR